MDGAFGDATGRIGKKTEVTWFLDALLKQMSRHSIFHREVAIVKCEQLGNGRHCKLR